MSELASDRAANECDEAANERAQHANALPSRTNERHE